MKVQSFYTLILDAKKGIKSFFIVSIIFLNSSFTKNQHCRLAYRSKAIQTDLSDTFTVSVTDWRLGEEIDVTYFYCACLKHCLKLKILAALENLQRFQKLQVLRRAKNRSYNRLILKRLRSM